MILFSRGCPIKTQMASPAQRRSYTILDDAQNLDLAVRHEHLSFIVNETPSAIGRTMLRDVFGRDVKVRARFTPTSRAFAPQKSGTAASDFVSI
jgi:hypothetical protein